MQVGWAPKLFECICKRECQNKPPADNLPNWESRVTKCYEKLLYKSLALKVQSQNKIQKTEVQHNQDFLIQMQV